MPSFVISLRILNNANIRFIDHAISFSSMLTTKTRILNFNLSVSVPLFVEYLGNPKAHVYLAYKKII